MSNEPTTPAPSDFIRDIVARDQQAGAYPKILTRFPPEPNGYLHIGHAKSICLNFGIAREFGGTCNLRMDDTNPIKEDLEYVESIQTDVRWLIGGTVVLANWPYSYYVVVPVNIWLCAVPASAAPSTVRELMWDWGLLEWGETMIGFAGCCFLAWSLAIPV